MWIRVCPGTCLVWVVYGLAGMSSNENAGESPYIREVRDSSGPAGNSGRGGPGSIEWQHAFAAANKGRWAIRSTLAE